MSSIISDELLENLGLSPSQITIYHALLHHGILTVGEIQAITNLELNTVLSQIGDIVSMGLVRPQKTKSGITRYYATLPFLKDYIAIGRDFSIALKVLKDSLDTLELSYEKSKDELLGSKIPAILNTLEEQLNNEVYDPLQQKADTSLKETSDHILSTKKYLDSQLKEYHNHITHELKTLTNFVSKLQINFKSMVSSEESLLPTVFSDISAQTHEILKSTQTDLQELFNKIKTTFDNDHAFYQALGNNLQAFMEHSISEFNTEISTFQNLIAELTPFEEQFEDAHTVFQEKLKNYSTLKKTITNLDQEIQNLQKAHEFIRLELNQHPDLRHLTPYLIEISDILKELQASKNSLEKEYNQTIENLDELSQQLTNVSKAFKHVLEKTQDYNAPSLSRLEEKLQDFINERDTKLRERVEWSQNTLKELSQYLSTTLNSLADKNQELTKVMKQAIEAKLEDLDKKFNTLFKQYRENVRDQIGVFVEELENIDAEFSKKIEETLDLGLESLKALSTELPGLREKQTRHVRKAISQETDEIINAISVAHNISLRGLNEKFMAFKTMLDAKIKLLRMVAEKSKEFKLEYQTDSGIVVGEPLLNATIEDFILRTNRSVLLVLPDLSLQMIDLIRTKIPMRKRVTLITDLDPSRDATLIRKLKEQGNIKLRAFGKKNLLACIRDDEEVLFCPVDSKASNKILTGIRSENEQLVTYLKLIINDNIIRFSKEIR